MSRAPVSPRHVIRITDPTRKASDYFIFTFLYKYIAPSLPAINLPTSAPGMLAPPLRRGVALPLLYVKQYKPDPWACQYYFLFSCQDRTPNQKCMSPRAPGGILLSPPPLQAHK
ncbi:hypothetical protein phAPEC8_00257 [Escherichia phage phAPEC8]|uniref:Uncharacterized protein n=1 Tax=Escherichia phage phAPEC8 TaxID=1229753 RepID=K7QJX1_9CAUD|nr:hypothetical protein G377_gp009 [Escherichia phage phAPEC8]AFU62828.1 hypothetical protein phAPEC8_00257 [Escherichia phage phAPEC8]